MSLMLLGKEAPERENVMEQCH